MLNIEKLSYRVEALQLGMTAQVLKFKAEITRVVNVIPPAKSLIFSNCEYKRSEWNPADRIYINTQGYRPNPEKWAQRILMMNDYWPAEVLHMANNPREAY